MKFLADMGISPKTVQWLINQGYDAIHLLDEGLEKLPDEKILDKAQAEKRVILTVDLDFGTLLAIAKTPFPSVVIFRLNNASRDVIETRFQVVLEKCLQDLEAGAILSVDDEKIRVRYLPI